MYRGVASRTRSLHRLNGTGAENSGSSAQQPRLFANTLSREAVERGPNLVQPSVFRPVEDVPYVLAELQVNGRFLQQETLHGLHVVALVLFPGDVQSCLGAVHGDAEHAAVDERDLASRAPSQSIVEPLGNVHAGCGAAQTLVGGHPQTPRVGGTITFEFDEEKGEDQAQTVGSHLVSHGQELGLLLGKCAVVFIPVQQVRHRLADFETGSHVWNDNFQYWESAALPEHVLEPTSHGILEARSSLPTTASSACLSSLIWPASADVPCFQARESFFSI